MIKAPARVAATVVDKSVSTTVAAGTAVANVGKAAVGKTAEVAEDAVETTVDAAEAVTDMVSDAVIGEEDGAGSE